MKHFKSTFLKGLITVLPLAITFYFAYWLVVTTEKVLESAITTVLPESFYIPGSGLLLVLVGTYLVGLIANVWLGEKLVGIGEGLLKKVPLVKTVYGSIKDLLSYFDVSDEKKLNKPAMVYFENLGIHMLGFVTQGDSEKLPKSLSGGDSGDLVAVYFPMSYQVGGYMLFVPQKSVSPLDMSIEEAMQYAITAGVSHTQEASSA